ncbi:MAG: TIGR03086 family metal-binding protein [Actinomycetota bacterium]|nr:TIGR03086 family metal-binding protein [Actinomycetota bacterium]
MDDEQVQMFVAATNAFGERVHAVDDAQWSAPTPDAEWSVADLVEHLVHEHRWAPPLLNGLDFEAAGKVADSEIVGGNLAQAWDDAAATSIDAAVADHALERTVAISRGDTDARIYLNEMILDAVVHSWDLATAIGFADPLSDDLVEYAYLGVEGAGDLSESGLFARPVDVPEDASTLEKLVAATGRDPRA